MNMNASLTEELANFVKAEVSASRYNSSSEVVREALRLMEKIEQQETEKLRFLRNAWKEGVDNGDAGEADFSALKQEALARVSPLPKREGMGKVRFTRRARQDLLDIWRHIASQNSDAARPRAARRPRHRRWSSQEARSARKAA